MKPNEYQDGPKLGRFLHSENQIYEPPHDKPNKKTCASTEDSE